ncbi:MAG: TraR/DksA C4-type zinc finger protein [Gemmatimonadaceae bacterium]
MPLTAKQFEHLEKRLQDERTRVQRDLEGFTQTESSDDMQDRDADLSKYPTHPADLGTDANVEEVDASIATRQTAELVQIDEALDRMTRTPELYGICENTGEEIPFERLDVIPWARTAVDSAT